MMNDAVGRLEPVKQGRVHERVATQLRERILAGDFLPGDRLPREQELIERFEVSRSAVRQAMQLLEQQGLVDVRVGSGGGTFVTEANLEPMLRSFTNLLALRGLDLREFLAAKAVVEPAIMAAAAESITGDQLDQLAENLRECRKTLPTGHDDVLFELTHDFHRIVAEATGNPILERMLVALVEVARSIPEFRGRPPGGWEGVLDDHEAIYRSLERRSANGVRRVASRHAASVAAAFTPDRRLT